MPAIMGHSPASSIAAVPARSQNVSRSSAQDDEAKIRTYLRLLVEAPVRASDRLCAAEAAFIEIAADWSARSGVDRRTLADLGVPRDILDAAGIERTPVAELVRRQYSSDPFTVADLVRRSGVSTASVRAVLAEDERSGWIGRLASRGRAITYGLL
jgi:hypothetical protein